MILHHDFHQFNSNFNNYYVVATSDDYYLDRETAKWGPVRWFTYFFRCSRLTLAFFFSCVSLVGVCIFAKRNKQHNKIIISRSMSPWVSRSLPSRSSLSLYFFHFLRFAKPLANSVLAPLTDWFFNCFWPETERERDMNVCILGWKSIHALSNIYRYFCSLLTSMKRLSNVNRIEYGEFLIAVRNLSPSLF